MSLFKKVLQTSPAYQAAKLGKQQLDKRKQQDTEKTEEVQAQVEPKAQEPVEQPQPQVTSDVKKQTLVMPLKERGEKILAQNLQPNEEVMVKLQGQFGQALVMTNKRLYIVKWGMQAGSTFGGKCIAYEYRNITAIEIRKHAMSRFVQILTPATQDRKLSYWANSDKPESAIASDFAVTYETKKDPLFQEAVNTARRVMEKLHEGAHHSVAADDSLDQLEKLAELKQKGILTDEEFQAKKKQLLGL